MTKIQGWDESGKNKNTHSRSISSIIYSFQSDDNRETRIYIYLSLCLILVVNLVYKNFFYSNTESVNTNRLILGLNSQTEPIQIPIVKSENLPAKKNEIHQIRSSEVTRYPSLVKQPYKPSWAVFGRIKDEVPFLSERTYYEVGPTTTDNFLKTTSFESNAILNPFLLIEPIWIDFSVWGQNPKLQNIKHPKLFQPQITSIYFDPKRNKAKATVELTSFLEELQLSRDENQQMIIPFPLSVNINSYNARDLGFNLIRWVGEASTNITSSAGNNFEVQIIEHIRFNPTLCSTEGCNHRTVGNKQLESFQLQQLPATAVFTLSRLKDNSSDNFVEFRLEIK